MAEIVGFIQILGDAFQRLSEIDEKYFVKFIQPSYELFEEIHEDYKVSFNNYISLLKDKKIPSETIIETIRKDSIFSQDIRSKLHSMVTNVPQIRRLSNNLEQYVQDYIYSIYDYFVSSYRFSGKKDDELIFEQEWPNSGRFDAIIFLSRNSNKEDRKNAILIFERIIKTYQYSYNDVVSKYNFLRTQMLS